MKAWSQVNPLRITVASLFVFVAVTLTSASSASAIALDPTFGVGGRSPSIPLPVIKRGKWLIVDSVTRSDGSVVVLLSNRRSRGATLISIGADGSIDLTFGFAGVSRWTPRKRYFYPSDLDQYSDGRLAVAGLGGVGSTRASIVRFTPHGAAIDRLNGVTKTKRTDPYGPITGVVVKVDAQQRAILAATLGRSIFVTRFDGPGARDVNFGNGGVARAAYKPALRSESSVDSISIQPASGGVVIAAEFTVSEYSCDAHPDDCPDDTGAEYDQVLARFTGEGRQDRSFGMGGFEKLNYGNHGVEVHASTDDALFVTANGDVQGTIDYWLPVAHKFTSAGSRERSFGLDGELFDPIAAGRPGVRYSTVADSTGLLGDGRVWACGSHYTFTRSRSTTLRSALGFVQVMSPESAGIGEPFARDVAFSPDHKELRCSLATDGSLTAVGFDSVGVSALRYR